LDCLLSELLQHSVHITTLIRALIIITYTFVQKDHKTIILSKVLYITPVCLHFNGHSPGGPGLANTGNVSILLDFIEAKDDGGGADNWSYKSYKAPVELSPPTNQHPAFYRPDVLPVTQPTASKH